MNEPQTESISCDFQLRRREELLQEQNTYKPAVSWA